MKKKRKPGEARVQFLACKPEIFEKIRAGYTVKAIFHELTEKGKISFSYSRMIEFLHKRYTIKNYEVFEDNNQTKKSDSKQKKEKVSEETKEIEEEEAILEEDDHEEIYIPKKPKLFGQKKSEKNKPYNTNI